jgi:glycosyltransferase involved in cell wall biosynthesis
MPTMRKIETIQLLTKKTGWYGGHSGYYEQLPTYLAEICRRVSVIKPRRNIFTRGVGKVYAWSRGFPQRDQSLTFAELCFRRRLGKSSQDIGHILNFEEHHLIFHPKERLLRNAIATIHIPPAGWSPLMKQCLTQLPAAIVLYSRDIPYFESRIGKDRVKFIHHGVDTEFFRPGNEKFPRQGGRRLIFAGQYLRNMAMLGRVVQKLLKSHPELEIDFVIPIHALATDGLRELTSLESITWHSAIADEELLRLYQNAYLMLLPMNDSGANNSVVEALACGLPIVTTAVGGIRDYGGGSLFPVVANDDDEAMLSLIERYLKEPDWRDSVSRSVRTFASEKLPWPLIAEKHVQAYQEITA